MALKPTSWQLDQLLFFLESCEKAANPPPAPSCVLRNPRLSAPPKPRPHPETLADLLHGEPAPFEATERLGGDRAGRVAQLYLWLEQFPGFAWMKEQPALIEGLKTFNRIQKRRKHESKFVDDVATIRFWLFAGWAVLGTNRKSKPPPTAGERIKAAAAAKTLRDIANKTTLFKAAGIKYPESDTFVQALDRLHTLATVRRRPRTDEFTNDRKYVEFLAEVAIWIFDDAPPALICEVAALKVKNPDKTSITKQVSAFKQTLRNEGVR